MHVLLRLPKEVDPLWTVGQKEEGKPQQQRSVQNRELEGIPFHKDRPDSDEERLQVREREMKDKGYWARCILWPTWRSLLNMK